MSILWMGNGWVSVVGLIMDVLGFGILAVDLLPEYRMTHVWRRLQAMYGAVFFADMSKDYIQKNRAGPMIVDKFKNASDLITSFIQGGMLEKINAIGNQHSQGWHGGTFEPTIVPEFNGTNHAVWFKKVEELANRARSQIAQRERPSIPVAIILITLGFFLQAWGSIPVAPKPHIAPAHFEVGGETPVSVTVDEGGGVTVLWGGKE